MRGTKSINWHPSIVIMLMLFAVPCAAQDHGSAVLQFERQGYADALGENHPRVHEFDGRIELHKQGFRNPDIRTTRVTDPTRSLILIMNEMSKKLAILERKLAALEVEVVQLRKAHEPIDPDDAAK